jgi:hypothetical protein
MMVINQSKTFTKMRNTILSVAFFITGFGLISCDDNDPKATLKENVASGELQELSSASFVLTREEANEEFEKFQWTETDFGFASSTTYKVQLDRADGDFSEPLEIASIDNLLSATITVGEMNKRLLEFGLDPDEAADVKIRVISIINEKIAPVSSAVKMLTITPYATSFPPIYMVGEALNGWNWNPGTPVEVLSSAPKIYETIAKFTNGKAFRFFAQKDWGPTSYNYPFFSSVDPKFENANDGDLNLKFIGTSGWYQVTVDLKTNTVVMLSVAEPLLYMTGAALNGWNWDPGNPVKLTFIKPGVFEANATFGNETFRFFAQADWGPTSYNYPSFTSVDSRFENANDGDKNLRFIGTPGTYKITVDLNNLTVAMTP